MCWVMPPVSPVDDRRSCGSVEQRRLAVVDVAQDRDDRRRALEVLGGVLRDVLDLFLGALDRDLALQLAPDQLDGLVGERLRDRDHLARGEHHLDDLGGRHAELVGELLDRDAGRERDRARSAAAGRPSVALAARIAAALLLLARAAGGLRVDHDAAALAGRDAALRTRDGCRRHPARGDRRRVDRRWAGSIGTGGAGTEAVGARCAAAEAVLAGGAARDLGSRGRAGRVGTGGTGGVRARRTGRALDRGPRRWRRSHRLRVGRRCRRRRRRLARGGTDGCRRLRGLGARAGGARTGQRTGGSGLVDEIAAHGDARLVEACSDLVRVESALARDIGDAALGHQR